LSEPKLISPLLDGFAMGAPISSHHGVRCCPAMRQNSDSKYIVKVLSFPASQVQLDALLLTGVYKDPGEAMDYFKAQAEDTAKEAEFLQTVSRLEGFLPFEGWQIVPMEDNNLGYQLYLLGSYKHSLDRHLRRSSISYQEAVRFGMDICSALAACRRAGYLYIALKPTNIFLSEDQECRIGDLGFVSLDSLKFSSLPGKYKSKYCPPELNDPLQTINATLDTYALGMILLQICCGGKLPENDESIPPSVPAELPKALGEVIRKAIALDPEERWQDPAQMGKALAECMNETDDTVIPVPSPDPGKTQVFSAEEVAAKANEAPEAASGSPSDTRVLPAGAVSAAVNAQTSLTQFSSDTKIIPTVSAPEAPSGDTKVLPVPQMAQTVSSDIKIIRTPQKQTESPTVNTASETRVMPKVTASGAPVLSQSNPASEKSSAAVAVSDYEDDFDEYNELDEEDTIPAGRAEERRVRKSVGKGWILPVILLLILGLLGFGGFYYYQNYYLQTIDSMTIEGKYDAFTVFVNTQIDESLLSVSCTDSYGNSMRKGLENGKVEFTDLLPNSQYKVVLEIEGFHKLVGKTSDVFNTESKTEIVSFTAIAGTEDGSVMFTFTVEGPEPEEWIIRYSAEGEETLSKNFTGHSVTIQDLVIPKEYTFTLEPSEDIYVDGQTSLQYTATELVMAQNLTITSFEGNDMTVRWDTPEGNAVASWSVRCYSDSGFDETLETAENKVVFTDLDPSSAYYVEVTANGMTQASRTTVTANPITVTSVEVSEEGSELVITWDHKGEAPDGGWLLMYSLDGSASQNIVKCAGTTARISPKYPGSEYRLIIQAADSTSIFSNTYSYTCPNVPDYEDHSFSVEKTVAYLTVTPDKKNWTSGDVSKEDYSDTFSAGQPISVILYCSGRFYIPSDEISVLFVIRNSEGQVIPSLTSQTMTDWHDLWVAHSSSYAELDIPTIPSELGSYTLQIYFNERFVASANFSIVE